MGEKDLTEEQKKELRNAIGQLPENFLKGMMDSISGVGQKQDIKFEKEKKTRPDKNMLALKDAFGDSLCKYLEYQGAAFTIKALEKRLESFIIDPNEREYGRENLEQVLNRLRSHGRINSKQHDGETHYFIPKQPSRSSQERETSGNIDNLILKYRSLPRNEASEFFNKGNEFGSRKDFKKAIIYHKKAVDIDPTFADGWSNLGADYMGINDLNNALICFNKAIGLDPHINKTWDNKGLLLIMQKKFDEAVQCFNESLKININNPIAKQNRKYALNQLKKTDFVSGFMRDIMEPSPEEIQAATKNLRPTQTIINQQEIMELEAEAKKLIYNGDFEDIIVLCDNLLEKDPNSAMGWFWKSKALSALAKDEEAINCYAKSCDLKKWITSQSNYFYAKSRLMGKSSKDLMRKMDKTPQSTMPIQSADSWNSQGAYAQTLGQFEVALYCFEKALGFNQEHSLAKRNRDRVIRLLKEEGYR